MARNRLQTMAVGIQFPCPAMNNTPIAGLTCHTFCQVPAKNAQFCSAKRCTSPWRLCRLCITERRLGKEALVVNPETGLCAMHEQQQQGGQARTRASVVKRSTELHQEPRRVVQVVRNERLAAKPRILSVTDLVPREPEREAIPVDQALDRFLSERSLQELEELKGELPKLLAKKKEEEEHKRQQEEEQKLLKTYRKWEKEAQEFGLTPKKLLARVVRLAGSNGHGHAACTDAKFARGTYRNPNDHSQTWGGVGKRPKWVMDHLGKGGRPQDLMVV